MTDKAQLDPFSVQADVYLNQKSAVGLAHIKRLIMLRRQIVGGELDEEPEIARSGGFIEAEATAETVLLVRSNVISSTCHGANRASRSQGARM